MVYEYILALIVKIEIFMRFTSFSIEKMKHIQPFYSIFCAKNDFEWHKKVLFLTNRTEQYHN